MGYWRRHPRKDLEEVLIAFHQAGWRIEDTGTYYRVKCPCGDQPSAVDPLDAEQPQLRPAGVTLVAAAAVRQ